MLAALGGRENLLGVEAVALTRLRVQLANEAMFDPEAAKAAGVTVWMRPAPGILHLVVGDRAPQFADRLQNR